MKLFNLVVTEPEVRGAFNKIVDETQKVFKDGHRFEGFEKVYSPNFDGGDPLATEKKNMVTTVGKRLDYTKSFVAKLLDFEASRDKTNTKATTDLVIDGVTLGKDLPATFLLSLEKKLGEIRGYYDAIPTLDLAREWILSQGSNEVYVNTAKQYRTAKQTKGVILAQATDKHAAQVKEVTEDVTIGRFDITNTSGALHPGVKAQLLANIDKLIEGTKQARMTANEAEVESVKIGSSIFDFIHSAK